MKKDKSYENIVTSKDMYISKNIRMITIMWKKGSNEMNGESKMNELRKRTWGI